MQIILFFRNLNLKIGHWNLIRDEVGIEGPTTESTMRRHLIGLLQ